jgi:hypothetical protein
MLDDPKTAFDFADWPRMVECRGKIKKNHGGGENTRTDNESGIPVPCCMHDEKWRSDQRAYKPCAMADAVGDFFALRLNTIRV